MLSELKSLRDIISSSVDTIVNVYEKAGVEFPTLNEPQQGRTATNDLRNQPEVAEAISKIVAGSDQLLASVQSPSTTIVNAMLAFYLPAALGVAEAGNIAEILREAGPKGMHIKELAEKSGMNQKKLSIVMFYLVTRHIFREIAPDVFTNNMLSSVLDSGKRHDSGLNSETKLDTPQGITAGIAFTANQHFKSASYLLDVMTDPSEKHSEEPNAAAWQKCFNTKLGFFEHLEQPENTLVRKNFSKFMSEFQPPTAVISVFDWGSLKPGSLVVDVGGGLGHVSMDIARACPELQVSVYDTPGTAKDAVEFWKANFPEAIEKQRVHFSGSSFFDPMPKYHKIPDVFLLRHILHDWPDKYAIKILRNLRDAAGHDTKLVIIDVIMEHACDAVNGIEQRSENPYITPPPKPLLRNWGAANLLVHNINMGVLGLLNAGERTQEDFEEILSASGWKRQEVHWPKHPSLRPSLVAVPM